MENIAKINIRGSINCLEIGENVTLPRTLCRVSSVRTIAGALTADTGKVFTVSATDRLNIIVTRTA